MTDTSVNNNDPQHIFWKESEKPVPAWFKDALDRVGGIDSFGDSRLRARYDGTKFKEGVWIIEEKWGPEAFGTVEDWKETQTVTDYYGTVDFGDFPKRGLYMAIMAWTDHEGRPVELSHDLIERLNYQRQMRETKNITPAQVALDVEMKLQDAEKAQQQRYEDAQKGIAEHLKTNMPRIQAAQSRVMSVPKIIHSLN